VLLRLFQRKFLLDGHIPELAGLEDIAAKFAFHELRIFVAGDDTHARVLTLWLHAGSRARGAVG
jgi:hypothetical protein